MTRFYKLNKNKLWLGFKVMSFFFTLAAGVLLLVAYYQHNLPSTTTILWILMGSAVGLPVLSILALMAPYVVRELKWKALNDAEAKLNRIGFVTTQVFSETNWLFTEEQFYKEDARFAISVSIAQKGTFEFYIYNDTYDRWFSLTLKALNQYSEEAIAQQIDQHKKG
ncbi:hypothetical protein [Flavobacterium sp. BFFFF1]|uniref:hypothetical protein n=1 Tax=Flavobacterium sp. BFFFF1 TaxID=2015557 RepID=UPI0025BB8F90|nr:hypothetical protein [Flavobacterium sp. BFFFF1]